MIVFGLNIQSEVEAGARWGVNPAETSRSEILFKLISSRSYYIEICVQCIKNNGNYN